MDEPKRHVVEDYPASKLPEDLRGGIDPSHRARVIVEDTTPAANGETARYRKYAGIGKRGTSIDEAVARIRKLRDEWD